MTYMSYGEGKTEIDFGVFMTHGSPPVFNSTVSKPHYVGVSKDSLNSASVEVAEDLAWHVKFSQLAHKVESMQVFS